MAVLFTDFADVYGFNTSAFVARKTADLGLSPASSYYCEPVTPASGRQLFNLRPLSDYVMPATPVDVYAFPGDIADTSNVSKGDALVGVKQPFTGAGGRTQHDKNAESVSASDFVGTDPTGATDSVPGFASAVGSNRDWNVQPGTYKLDATFRPPTVNGQIFVSPRANFTGAGQFAFDNIIEFQLDPSFSISTIRKEFTTEFNAYQLLNVSSSHAKNSASGPAAVAVYGLGESHHVNGRAFGGNLLGIVSVDGGRATALEADVGFRGGATTGNLYGITISTSGPGPATAALQIQCNDVNSQWGNGFNFSFNAVTPTPSGNVTGALIRAGSNAGIPASCQKFLYATPDMQFTLAEIDLPSFVVEGTPVGVANRISIQSGSTGQPGRVKATGTDANVTLGLYSQGAAVISMNTNGAETFRVAVNNGPDRLQATSGTTLAGLSALGSSADIAVAINGKGALGVQLRDGGNLKKFEIATGGVGFFAAVPVAQSTGWGTPTGGAITTSFPGATATLIQTAQTLAALLSYLKSRGDIGA